MDLEEDENIEGLANLGDALGMVESDENDHFELTSEEETGQEEDRKKRCRDNRCKLK